MIWFFYILMVVFVAAYVYFSLQVATKLLTKILNLEKQVTELFENDDWCEEEIKSLSKSNDDLFDDHMSTTSKIWQKIDELNNDINRAKMRVGKLEQGKSNADNHNSFIADPIVITCSEENSPHSNS